MSGRRGVTLIKLTLASLWLLAAPLAQAISVGNLTFSLASDAEFAAKRVINNNKKRAAISGVGGGYRPARRP